MEPQDGVPGWAGGPAQLAAIDPHGPGGAFLTSTAPTSVIRRALGRSTDVASGATARSAGGYEIVFYVPWTGPILSRRNPRPVGGAETQILMLAEALAERELRVAIVSYGEPGDLPEKVGGVDIVTRPPYRRHGVLDRIFELVTLWRTLAGVPRAPVVYRGMSFELALIALYMRLARRRLIFSSAIIVAFDSRRAFGKRLPALMYEIGVRLADTIVVQTEEQVELCQKVFRRTPQLIKSIASPGPSQVPPPEAFLWAGRLASHKRPLEYLALAETLPEARFWMIAVPPANPDDEALAATVAARASRLSNLELLGPRSHAEVQEFMARAVASVNTSDFEGMPNIFLEAWACGVPALALTHDPGEVISAHGLGGFAGGSTERFVALAREYWERRHDPEERGEISERCRGYLARHHSPDVVAGQWADLLLAGS